jgi:3-phosphoglycerate kinase
MFISAADRSPENAGSAMVFEFLTLDDVDLKGKTVFLRVDINSPLDPVSKRILDARRITETIDTLQELVDARVVLGAHQSRPGRYDFTSLELHARVLRMYLNEGGTTSPRWSSTRGSSGCT